VPESATLLPLPVRADLPEPTEAEVDALAALLTDAWERGIRYGHWTLARVLLGAGYRLAPEPEPVRYGQCGSCTGAIRLNDSGALGDHDDPRRGRPCIGAHMVPLRLVDAPEVVSTDA
jgi:hypothetical protein